MKRKLFVLPFIALLSSCDAAKFNLPAGDVIIVADKKELEKFNEILDADLNLTSEEAKSGLKVSIESEITKLNIESIDKDETNKVIEQTKLNIDKLNTKSTLEIAARKEEDKYKDLKAALKLENAGGKIGFNLFEKGVSTDFNLDFSRVKAALYLNEGNLYADLSNKNLRKTVDDVLNQTFSKEEKQFADTILDTICNKFVFNNVMEDDEGISVPDFDEYNLSDMVILYISEMVSNEYLREHITFVIGKNASIGLQYKGDLNKLFEEEEINGTSEGNITVLFNKKGLLSSIAIKGDLNIDDGDEKVEGKAQYIMEFDYGVDDVKMPDFSDYKPFSLF